MDVFVVGTDSALYHKWWNGSAWGPSVTGYEPMGGKIIADRGRRLGPNRLDVFVVGTDSALPQVVERLGVGSLRHRVRADGPRSSASRGRRLGAEPLGRVRGRDGLRALPQVVERIGVGSSVTGYEPMGGKILGRPRVVAWGPNRLDVFVVGTDSALYHKWWDGSAWHPSVTGWADGRVIVRF